MQNQKGLTLIEVMISMVILALGLFGLAPMVAMSIQGNVVSRDVQTASGLARDKIEYYEGLDSLPALPFSELQSVQDQQLARQFVIATAIQDSVTDTLVPGGLSKLEVSISWNDDVGMNRSSVYTTYLKAK